MATFAKAMSNGYPMAAAIGTRDVMEATQNTFISSTSWTDKIGPVVSKSKVYESTPWRVEGQENYLNQVLKDIGLNVMIKIVDILLIFQD